MLKINSILNVKVSYLTNLFVELYLPLAPFTNMV